MAAFPSSEPEKIEIKVFYVRTDTADRLDESCVYLTILDFERNFYALGSDHQGNYKGSPVRFVSARYGDTLPKMGVMNLFLYQKKLYVY